MTILHSLRQTLTSSLIMDGSTSLTSINSRSTAIKSILLTAWRAKLTNEEWETRIRKVLPRGVSGDIYDLADCLLRQALVGPVPNQLFISYLKHAVKCGLVSYGAVLGSIANQLIPNRSSSITCLLEFLRTFRDQLSCAGSEVECLNLCNSLSKTIHWLLKCVNQCIWSLNDGSNNNNNQNPLLNPSFPLNSNTNFSGGNVGPNTHNPYNIITSATNTTNNDDHNNIITSSSTSTSTNHNDIILGIIDSCAEAILDFVGNSFTRSLLFISTIEYEETFESIRQILESIQEKLSQLSNQQQTNQITTGIKNSRYISLLQELNIDFKSRDMHPSILASEQLKCIQMNRTRSTLISTAANLEKTRKLLQQNISSSTNYGLFNSLYALVAFDVVLRPARSHQLLARQIATITNFNSAPISMTYCELIRVCLVGLVDTDGTPAKQKWAFFTFLKLPKLLLELSKVCKNPLVINNDLSVPVNPSENYASNQNTKFVDDLKIAIGRLCEYSPLLDDAEYRYNCDFFKCLVRELNKKDPGLVGLKTIDLRRYSTKRAIPSPDDNNGVAAHVMLKTDPVVASLLKAFDSENNIVEIFPLMSQFVNGKQFDITLNGAAATGRLEVFVKKLVEQNELNTISQSDKNPYVQALMFDITFLILAYIPRQYGPEVIGTESTRTFEKWFTECYNQETRINCPNEMIKGCQDEIVEDLLRQLVDPNSQGIRMEANVNWRDVCFNIPKVISEIVRGLEQGLLSEDDIKSICERIKSKMCFIAVVAANWLQCYIRVLNENRRVKPLMILYNLTKASSSARQQQRQSNSTTNGGLKSENYVERSSLMCSIIRRMHFEFVPKPTSINNSNISGTNSVNPMDNSNIDYNQMNANDSLNMSMDQQDNNSAGIGSHLSKNQSAFNTNESATNQVDLSSSQAVNDRFISLLSTQDLFLAHVKQCLNRGWIDHKSLNSMSSLFKMIGSDCFTNLVVHRVLTSHESPSDLARAVNISFGIFHLDLNACAVALLKETVPSWLMGEKKQNSMNQPRAYALAHLTVMTIIEVFNNLKTTQLIHSGALCSSTNNGAGSELDKISRKLIVINGIKQEPMIDPFGNKSSQQQHDQPSKRMKFSHEMGDNTNNQVNAIALTNKTNSSKIVIEEINVKLRDLNGLVSKLMKLFREIMSDKIMSHRTLFPLLFLQQTVVCARESSSIITGHLQPEILLDIINLFSSELTFELVLAISNLSDTIGRQFAAKATCELANRQVKQKKQQLQQNLPKSSGSSSLVTNIGTSSMIN